MSAGAYNTNEPVAFIVTWTTYGTWLPGDDRGWRRKGQADVQSPNRLLAEANRLRMTDAAFVLSMEHRRIVEHTVREHCTIRNWALHAVNARTNHVHVVVTAAGYEPKTVRDQFKAWCTRKLKEAGVRRETFWTERGSCGWINSEDELEAAVTYVMEAQDRKARDEPR